MTDDYLKYDGRIPEPPYVNALDLLDQAQEEQRNLESRIAELKEQIALAANNTAAADLAQEMEFMRTKMTNAVEAFAEWESVRTYRNDINSHEWFALVASMTALEKVSETPTPTDFITKHRPPDRSAGRKRAPRAGRI